MRSISFEENDDFLIKPPQSKNLKKFSENPGFSQEEGLLDTHENSINPDIPTISCYTVSFLRFPW